MTTLVFNGWAAGPEAWALTHFRRDWTFSYVEELDGLPERVMNDLPGPFLFVGFSMGGTYALERLLDDPSRVAALVLVSTTPRMMSDDAASWRGLSERRIEALRLGTELLFADDPSPLYAPDALQRGLRFLRTEDVRAPLRKAAPSFAHLRVEIVHSERDGIVRPQSVSFLKSVFPQAHVTWIPGSEHVLPVTAPREIDAAVRRVCRKESHEN